MPRGYDQSAVGEVRVHKILAASGFGSRRHCEELIAGGRVSVDGRAVTEPGAKADPERSRIEVDGVPARPEEKVYLAFNKPPGCITTMKDPQGRKTIVEYLEDVPGRVFPVGRLDLDTEGLLLLTNDGDFAESVSHPGRKVMKTYEALVDGVPGEEQLEKLRRGVEVNGALTAPAEVRTVEARDVEIKVKKRKGSKTRKLRGAVLEIRIHEGRKRQVKRMAQAVGLRVLALKRTRVGGLSLGDLPAGRWRYLDVGEIKKIFE
ncbi:MAG: pseudouridine synthase [bacterium]